MTGDKEIKKKEGLLPLKIKLSLTSSFLNHSDFGWHFFDWHLSLCREHTIISQNTKDYK